jgi:hypothetical protein
MKYQIILLICLAIILYPQFAYAIFPIKESIVAQKFPDNGIPTGRRRGGTGRKYGCPEFKPPITAITPGEDTSNKSFLGFTVAKYPIFWVYLPPLPENISTGEFILQDEKNNDIWRTTFTLPKSGMMGIPLPRKPQYALKINNQYRWYFKVNCLPSEKPEYIFVDAWVQRMAFTPQLQRQLQQTSQKYTVYRANNLWYDSLSDMAQLRRKYPNNQAIAQIWHNLLKDVGLEELAGASIGEIKKP